jgi:hypothetical protein
VPRKSNALSCSPTSPAKGSFHGLRRAAHSNATDTRATPITIPACVTRLIQWPPAHGARRRNRCKQGGRRALRKAPPCAEGVKVAMGQPAALAPECRNPCKERCFGARIRSSPARGSESRPSQRSATRGFASVDIEADWERRSPAGPRILVGEHVGHQEERLAALVSSERRLLTTEAAALESATSSVTAGGEASTFISPNCGIGLSSYFRASGFE